MIVSGKLSHISRILLRCRHSKEITLIINIQDDILKLNDIGVLDKLLVDKTTKKNIVWATDAYNYVGEEYDRSKQITVL